MGRRPDKPRDMSALLSSVQYRQDELWAALALDGALPEGTEPPAGCILPVLVAVRQWNKTLTWRQQLHYGRAVEGHIRGILILDRPGSGVVQLGERRYLTGLCLKDKNAWDEVGSACGELIRLCQEELMCDVSCCVGAVTGPARLGAMTDQLVELDSSNVAEIPMRFLGSGDGTAVDLKKVLEQGSVLLRQDRFDAFLEHIYQCLTTNQERLTPEVLNGFAQDMLQMLYTVMHERDVAAHTLFVRPESMKQFRDAPLSVNNTVTWIFCAVTTLSEALKQRQNTQSYTEQAKNYIRAHLRENFTRQDIADYVHLSQNHLARIFRRETGMSIAEFTLRQRMEQAAELLTHTEMSVGAIAERVGYENYSYFLTLFRRVTAMTPSKFREKYAEKNLERGEKT